MSKNSAKQNVDQLMDWLNWRKSTTVSKKGKTVSRSFSKADVYKQTRENYGRSKSN